MGQRGHDHTCVPLCHKDHMDFHNVTGHFKGWEKARRKSWQAEQAGQKLAAYVSLSNRLAEPTTDWDKIF